MSDVMTEARHTTQSQLAPHRFVPYHFKGLRPEQIEQIRSEREGQVIEHGDELRNRQEEEYQWAVQNLANNTNQLNNEIDLQNKYQDARDSMRDHNLEEKVAKDARWPNMYGDQDPLPEVTQ